MTKCVVCHKESELTNGKCDMCINEEIQQCIDLFEGTSKPRKKLLKNQLLKLNQLSNGIVLNVIL